LPAIYKRIDKLEKIQKIQDKLDLAEIINIAYVGSKPDKRKSNIRNLRRWRSQLINEACKLLKLKQNTIWDSFKKKSRVL